MAAPLLRSQSSDRSELADREGRGPIGGEDYRTIVFAEGRGFLDDQVFEELGVVVLDRLTWLG